MAGKAWCCGPSSGGGGGLAAVATADTGTVNLEGDGSAGAPLTATVLIQPFEPNGLEITPVGLRVRPSGDAGNRLEMGSDSNLFVPPVPTNVAGVAPGTAVGTNRSVDVDVVEGPADTWTVGARLTPPWDQTPQTGVSSAGDGIWSPGPQLSVPETGVYLVEAFVYGEANVAGARASAAYTISGRLTAGGVDRREGTAVQVAYTQADPQQSYNSGTTTLTWRGQLTAGAVVQVSVRYSGVYFAGDGFGASAFVAYNKIAD